MPVPLIVVAAVLLVLTALGLLRVRLTARYDGELHLAVGYAFLTIRLGGPPRREKPAKKKKEPEEKKKPDIRQFLKLFRQFAGSLKRAAAAFLRRLRIDRLAVDLSVCGGDAADTAILYGEACAAVYGSLGVIASLIPVRRHDIAVRPLFAGGDSRIEAECILSIRLGALLWAALSQSVLFLVTFLRGAMAARKTAAAAAANQKEGVTHE